MTKNGCKLHPLWNFRFHYSWVSAGLTTTQACRTPGMLDNGISARLLFICIYFWSYDKIVCQHIWFFCKYDQNCLQYYLAGIPDSTIPGFLHDWYLNLLNLRLWVAKLNEVLFVGNVSVPGARDHGLRHYTPNTDYSGYYTTLVDQVSFKTNKSKQQILKQ